MIDLGAVWEALSGASDFISGAGAETLGELLKKAWIPLSAFFTGLLAVGAWLLSKFKSATRCASAAFKINQPVEVRPISNMKLLREVYAFDSGSYGMESVSFDIFSSWWRACPSGFLCAFKGNSPIAVIGVFPVTASWAKQFIARKVDENKLTADDIRSSKGKYWYISGISCRFKPTGLSKRLEPILTKSIEIWLEQNEEFLGAEEIRFISEGVTDVGEHILNHFRFELYDVGTSEADKPRFQKETSVTKIRLYLSTGTISGHRLENSRHRGLKAKTLSPITA